MERVDAARASAWAWFPCCVLASLRFLLWIPCVYRWEGGSTGAMGNNAPHLDLVFTMGFEEAEEGMECAARFEGADPLVVLAFEEEAEFRARWRLGCGWGGCVRGRGDGVEGLAGEERGAVDVLLDEGVGRVDGRRTEGFGLSLGWDGHLGCCVVGLRDGGG